MSWTSEMSELDMVMEELPATLATAATVTTGHMMSDDQVSSTTGGDMGDIQYYGRRNPWGHQSYADLICQVNMILN